VQLAREYGATRREVDGGSDPKATPLVVTSSRFVLLNQIFEWLRRLLERSE
jgi:hypothetical protein